GCVGLPLGDNLGLLVLGWLLWRVLLRRAGRFLVRTCQAGLFPDLENAPFRLRLRQVTSTLQSSHVTCASVGNQLGSRLAPHDTCVCIRGVTLQCPAVLAPVERLTLLALLP